ncbi:probable translation initiation factor eIF-2B subunit delta isoform X1 [Folsomia candida]|nr:probable translation initiation factor eIF-2B subunit delta isoform X1 [Folsomia candida]
MASGLALEDRGGDEEGRNVLQTLASIKSQISSVLGLLQTAHVSAEGAAAAAEMSSPSATVATTLPVDESEAISRDDVKAQREAKKAAKAARKNKSLGGESVTADGNKTISTPKNNAPKEKKEKVSNPVGGPKVHKEQNLSKPDSNKPSKCEDKAEEVSQEKNPPAKPTNTPAKIKESIEAVPEPEVVNAKSSATIEPAPKPRPTFESLVEKVHPKFRELGLKYSNYILRGSNQRTIALLSTTKSYILGYRTPEGKGFKQDLSSQLQFYYEKLKLYRPYAVGMTTAVEGVNAAIRALEEGMSDPQYKEELEEWVDRFIEEKITKAVEAIAEKGAEKIREGDTILTFSLTDAIYETFKLAGESGTRFNLVLAITKSDHYLAEYTQLKQAMGGDVLKSQVNISCINLSSIMSFISSVDKVFLGGHALFTTGGVMAHAGASTVALCASHHNIPVIFFCETYKFCDKSPTDAFYSDVFPENKFGLAVDKEVGVEDDEGLTVARICYDVTPVDLVTCVITDIDMLPSSSVPVVLRVQESRPLTKCL